MSLLTPDHADYPPWLREISDRPLALHLRGQLVPGRRYVACVGTRQPSMFGQAAARGIAGFLAAHGWSIVSGLAQGVDTLCHEDTPSPFWRTASTPYTRPRIGGSPSGSSPRGERS